MRTQSLIGIDVGTTRIKVVAYDLSGQVLAFAGTATPMRVPQPGWAELEAEDLITALHDSLRVIGRRTGDFDPAAIGVATFGVAGFLLSADGTVLHPAIAWYDRRTESYRERLRAMVADDEWFASSGMTPDHIYSILKLMWIRDHLPQTFARAARWLCLEDFVIRHLTGEAAIEYSLAGRTGAFDRRSRAWNTPLLARVGIGPEMFAPAFEGGHAVGRLRPAVAADVGLPSSTVVCTGGHDHVCAAYALGALRPRTLVDSTGTAEAVEMVVPALPDDAAVMGAHYDCYAHAVRDRYVLSGHNPAVGAVLEWARGFTGMDGSAFHAQADLLAASVPPGADGLTCLPFFGGSGSPVGNRGARALVNGLSLQTSRADLVRAFYEGTAFWLLDNVETMAAMAGYAPDRIVAGGGGSRSSVWVQIKADVLGCPIHVPEIAEAGAFGAALLAGCGAGLYPTPEAALEHAEQPEQIAEPDVARHTFYASLREERYDRWRDVALGAGADDGSPAA